MGLVRRLTGFAPFGTVLDDPIGQRPFKADVMPGFFRLDPLVFENLLALGLKLAIERGVLQQVAGRWFFRLIRHSHYEFGMQNLRRPPASDNNLLIPFFLPGNKTSQTICNLVHPEGFPRVE